MLIDIIDKTQMYIVRCATAEIFYGNIIARHGQEVEMTNCRRLWEWHGAVSLFQIAVSGVAEPENSKVSIAVDDILILDAVKIIPMTDKAVISLATVKEWKI